MITDAGGAARRSAGVHATEATREFAHDRPSRIGQLERVMGRGKGKRLSVDMKQG